MKIIIEMPDDKAEDFRGLITRLARNARNAKKGSQETWLSIGEPGIGAPVSESWFAARVLSLSIRK